MKKKKRPLDKKKRKCKFPQRESRAFNLVQRKKRAQAQTQPPKPKKEKKSPHHKSKATVHRPATLVHQSRASINNENLF